MSGIKIYNASSVLVVDESYKNLEYKTRLTLTVPASGGLSQTGPGRASFSTPGYEKEIIAYRIISGVGVFLCGKAGNTYTLGNGSPSEACIVDVYVFAEPSYSDSGIGLVVKNETGQVAFNSSSLYMRVVGQYKVPDAQYNGGNVDETAANLEVVVPPGKYAATISGFRIGYGVRSGISTWFAYSLVDHLLANDAMVRVSVLPAQIIGQVQAYWPTQFEQRIGGVVTLIDVSSIP